MIRIGVFVATLGLACFFAFHLIGASVGLDGFLREPFALLPIGYLFVFAGMLMACAGFISGLISRRSAKESA